MSKDIAGMFTKGYSTHPDFKPEYDYGLEQILRQLDETLIFELYQSCNEFINNFTCDVPEIPGFLRLDGNRPVLYKDGYVVKAGFFVDLYSVPNRVIPTYFVDIMHRENYYLAVTIQPLADRTDNWHTFLSMPDDCTWKDSKADNCALYNGEPVVIDW